MLGLEHWDVCYNAPGLGLLVVLMIQEITWLSCPVGKLGGYTKAVITAKAIITAHASCQHMWASLSQNPKTNSKTVDVRCSH